MCRILWNLTECKRFELDGILHDNNMSLEVRNQLQYKSFCFTVCDTQTIYTTSASEIFGVVTISPSPDAAVFIVTVIYFGKIWQIIYQIEAIVTRIPNLLLKFKNFNECGHKNFWKF